MAGTRTLRAPVSTSSFAQIYTVSDPNAPWRKLAEDRIEQIRKGDLRVEVRDAAGIPVVGAAVHVQMLRHAFIFGAEVEPEIILDQIQQDAAMYRQKIVEMFNTVVFGHQLGWGPWEVGGVRDEVARATAWLESQGIAQRGLSLMSGSCDQGPPDVCGLMTDPTALRRRIANHITEETTTLAGHIVQWDVINEPYKNNEILDLFGRGSLSTMVSWFKLAHWGDRAATLYLNEVGVLEDYGFNNEVKRKFTQNAIEYLLKNGAPIGGLGLESHFLWPPNTPEDLLVTLDRFGALGVALEGTEFDIVGADETQQADFMRDYLTVMFSHPSVVGVLVWGFWEGAMDHPDSALYRPNWSLRPAGQVWVDLTQNQWWTDTQGATDATGDFATRGFLGDYEITVDAAGLTKTVTTALPKRGMTVQITLN